MNLWNHAGGQGCTGWYHPLLARGRRKTASSSRPAATNTSTASPPTAGRYGKRQMPGQMLGSPVLDREGHVYVGVGQLQRGQQPRGMLVCVDGNSHKIRWQYPAAGPVESTPVIGDDDI